MTVLREYGQYVCAVTLAGLTFSLLPSFANSPTSTEPASKSVYSGITAVMREHGFSANSISEIAGAFAAVPGDIPPDARLVLRVDATTNRVLAASLMGETSQSPIIDSKHLMADPASMTVAAEVPPGQYCVIRFQTPRSRRGPNLASIRLC